MGKKILLADDSITIQKVIELTFSDEDFEVVTVGNGRLAIEKVQDVQPDVVLCDIIMPEKDGYEVCDFIKKHPTLSSTPVLLLTGAFEPFDQERASRVGCDGFLAKPFEPQALIAKVKDLLRQSGRRDEAAAPAAAPAVAPPAPAPAPPAPAWAAVAEAPASPVWEAPQTRPSWSTAAAPPAPPAPVADEGAVHFIPEDPFTDEAVGFAPVSDHTQRVPTYDPGGYDETEVEPEPYELEAGATADELLPVTADEQASLGMEPPPEAVPPAPAATPAPAASPVMERDLFLEEVFEEAAASLDSPSGAAPAAASVPEPPPLPAEEPSVPDFAAVARDAGVAPVPPAPEPVSAPPAFQPEPEPEPEPVAELEPEPEPEEPSFEIVSQPASAEPATDPDWAPEPVAAAPLEPPPMPEPPPAPPIAPEAIRAREPEPVVNATATPEAIEDESAGAPGELELEEESFAELAPSPEPAAEPPATAAAPSEAAGVAVPVDMVSQIAQRVVAQISEKVIREIAWEVIPDMAEALIKKEIERLTAELSRT